jgi:hypothetical protein
MSTLAAKEGVAVGGRYNPDPARSASGLTLALGSWTIVEADPVID